MRNTSYHDISRSRPSWSPMDHAATGHSQTRSFGFFKWWYRLTMPVKLPANARFLKHAGYHKTRLFSSIAFFLLIAFVFALPIGLFSPSPYMLYIDSAEIAITCVSLLLNRMGQTLAAGLVQVVSFEVILTSVILITTPLNSASMQIFDLFIVGELLAVSLLPVRYGLLVALYNSLFIWLNISLQPYTPDMILVLHSQFISIVARTIGLQFMVAGISAIWAYNTTKAISNGGQAEMVAAQLEHALTEQRKELESDIQQILQTYVSVANGNLNARVPLTQDHVLWQTARALNSLLVRLQRASLAEKELHRVQHAVTSTVNIIQKSVQQRQKVHIPFTQTAIDPLIAAIQGKTFAFTKPLLQQHDSQSASSINAHTINAKPSSHHTFHPNTKPSGP